MPDTPQISPLELKQELANSWSHAVGILLGLIGLPILIAAAAKNANHALLTGAIVYGISYLLVFTCSTCYHGIQQPRRKHLWHVLDHISIYFLIAGSYTPFILAYWYNAGGVTLLLVLWSLTLAGTVFKIFFVNRFQYASTFVYVAMGWMLLPVGPSFFASMPPTVGWLIATGGLCYSVGVVFYLWPKFFYHHLVWHLCVLAGSLCHYAAVWLAVS